jgi:hypothetical protein
MVITLELVQILSSTAVGICIGAAPVYFTAYLREKGKSRALKEDVIRLEDEKQGVISKYQKDIENVKKTHQLDIEKRKHQYESKKSQYYQFMQEIDEFNGCLARTLSDDFSQIMLKFYEFTNNVSNSSKEELTVEFNNKAQAAVGNIKAQEMKLFSRLNAFKLSANSEIITHLEELMHEIQKSKKNLVDILNYIGSPEFQITRNVPEKILAISDSNQSDLANAKDKLMTALKRDLDEI